MEFFKSERKKKIEEEKQKEQQNKKRAQDLLNISGFQKNTLYTKDNRALRLIEIETTTIDLLSKRDKRRLTDRGTEALRPLRDEFEFFVVSQPTNLNDYFNEFKGHIKNSENERISSAIRNQIEDISELASSSLSEERKYYVVYDAPGDDGAERDLDRATQLYMRAFKEAEYTVRELTPSEAKNLIGLVSHPALADKYNEEDYLSGISFIFDMAGAEIDEGEE